jgi:hypothetical protein
MDDGPGLGLSQANHIHSPSKTKRLICSYCTPDDIYNNGTQTHGPIQPDPQDRFLLFNPFIVCFLKYLIFGVLVFIVWLSFLNLSNRNTWPSIEKAPFTRKMIYLIMIIVKSVVGRLTLDHRNHALFRQDSGSLLRSSYSSS